MFLQILTFILVFKFIFLSIFGFFTIFIINYFLMGMNAVCPGSEACGSVFCRQWPENIVPDGELVGAKFGRLPEKSLSLPIRGEVLEWLKRRAWKARIRLKRIRGSNPLLSANDRVVGWVANIRLQPFLFSGWTNLSGAV